MYVKSNKETSFSSIEPNYESIGVYIDWVKSCHCSTQLYTSPQPNYNSEELKLLAAHEAGHALCSFFLHGCKNGCVKEISIDTQRENIIGYAATSAFTPIIKTRSSLLKEIQVLLAGRTAELLICEDCSEGAVNDIQRATQIAENIVKKWGMSQTLPPVYIEKEFRVSEEYLKMIDREVREVLTEQNHKSTQLLKDNINALEKMIALLQEKKILNQVEIENIFQECITTN